MSQSERKEERSLRNRSAVRELTRAALSLPAMDMLTNVLGGVAACLTAFASIPQVLKCFRTGKSGDLSMKMLIALASGFLLWLIYGLMRGDLIIVAANAMSLVLAAILLSFKMRENAASHAT